MTLFNLLLKRVEFFILLLKRVELFSSIFINLSVAGSRQVEDMVGDTYRPVLNDIPTKWVARYGMSYRRFVSISHNIS